jgi:tRNA guanosine-2'-O-methyltransferase
MIVVVNNLKMIEDQHFLSTSVSAEKWMPLTEVKMTELHNYLLEKRKDGYTLIGIEQATNSISLDKFSFPKRVVLLLGMEREGIPVDYLHILDYIIEIPQYGLIRSLNVHVSASLVLWEYVKQSTTRL